MGCNDDDAEIKLKDKEKGTQTCQKIKKKKWCDEEVKNSDGLTAVEFCYSCDCDGGISQAPTGVPTGVPTGTPSEVPTLSTPDDKCKSDEDEIKLTEKGLQTCATIAAKEWCDKEVKKKDGKTAAKFCTSCCCGGGVVGGGDGCGGGGGGGTGGGTGGGGGDDDDNCVDTEEKIELKSGTSTKCKNITTKQCDEKVKDDPDKKVARELCPTACKNPGC